MKLKGLFISFFLVFLIIYGYSQEKNYGIGLSAQEANTEINKLISNKSPQDQWIILNQNIDLAKKAWGNSFDYNYWSYECWKTGNYNEERPTPKKQTKTQQDRIQYLDNNSIWYDSDYRKAMDIGDKVKYIESQMILWSNKDFVAKKQDSLKKNCSLGYAFWRTEYFVIAEMIISAGNSYQVNNVLIDSCDRNWQQIAATYDVFVKNGMKFED